MPIYEYECAQCGHTLEAIQKVSEAALTRCPACRQDSLHKRVSAPAFHLKGGGWYVTDFRDKPKPGKPGAQEGKTQEAAGVANASPQEKTGAADQPGKSAPAGKSEPTATE